MTLALAWPLELEYFSGLTALGLWVVLCLPVVFLGVRALATFGPVFRWVVIGLRLAVLLLLVLILGGVRYSRFSDDVEVLVLHDNSLSTQNYHPPTTQSYEEARKDFLDAACDPAHKLPRDRIGVIYFNDDASIESLPNTYINANASPIQDYGHGTNIAAAIQLALATFRQGSMRRMVLLSDGNANIGDTDAAVDMAASLHVPIDVVCLHYDIENALMMERLIAPSWKRQKEPFTVEIFLRSTNPQPVTGRLSLVMATADRRAIPVDLDPGGKDSPARHVALNNGLNRFPVTIPGLSDSGVYTFRSSFEPDQPMVGAAAPQLIARGSGSAFTYVRGTGQVLYVDNAPQGGHFLKEALDSQGISVRTVPVGSAQDIISNLAALQGYDAVILSNVPRGAGGLSEDDARTLAAYVHETGGGLVMIGGPDTFGAGGWHDSKLEEILPVTMDIPAQRIIPKGALVLIMHACEMPDGNFWGEQCALKAIEALGRSDQIGVVSYDWNKGGAAWVFPLGPKEDGSRVIRAVKAMNMGDMPSFDDSMKVALDGTPGAPGLAASDAREKHVIIISDGDPSPPGADLIDKYKDAEVSVSTVSVYPHDPNDKAPNLKLIANELHGRSYGPINGNWNQLPQIFIKEASLVRRSLVYEDNNGIPVLRTSSDSDMVKGIKFPPAIRGMVLTGQRQSPNVELPLVAGPNSDPLLAHWQAGLGKVAVFTSDAQPRWAVSWVASPSFAKFWGQVVRGVTRAPMPADYDVQTVHDGDRGHVRIEAAAKETGFVNFLTIRGHVVGPDMKVKDVRLVQTGPGTYEGDFDAAQQGNYVLILNPQDANGSGTLVSGMAVDSSPEQRELHSNERYLRQIVERTHGRWLEPWDAKAADLFSKQGLVAVNASQPAWDILIPFLLGLILLDVAARRIAWDMASLRRAGLATAEKVRQFTTVRKVETRAALDALRELKGTRPFISQPGFQPLPDPKAKFQATGPEGDITKLVGGATNQPVPPPTTKKVQPKGTAPAPGSHTDRLLQAKRRAQQAISEKEKDKEKEQRPGPPP